jgi:TonB dependent receptor
VDYLNGAAFVILTPPDAVQEVNVQTSDFTAEYGRAGSAVMNVTTKSGTNKFSGDVWEYLRNNDLDASTWSANRAGTPKPELRQNQYGFTVGGPVYIPRVYNGHNKTFFFGDFQGTRIAQQSLHNPTVPTAAERDSGFTNFQDQIFNQSGTRTDDLGRILPQGSILDPATTRAVTMGQVDPVTGLIAQSSGYARDPFFQGSVAGITNFATSANERLMNILPAGRVDPNAVKLLSAYPAPNTTGFNGGLSSNYVALQPQPDDTNQFDIRADQNFREKDQMFARVGYAGRTRNIPGDFTGPLDNSGYGQGAFVDHSVNAALSETHIFSPTTINEVRIGYSRLTDSAEPAVANVSGIPQQFGIQGVPQGAGLGGLPLLEISGLTAVGPGEFATPNTRVSDTRQITENLTKIRGSHTFKGGFEGQFIRFSFNDPRDPRGRMDFRGSYTGIPGGSLGSGMADMLLTPIAATVPNGVNYDGGPGYVIADSDVQPDNIRHYYGAYFQDDWKVTPKLTVNLGVRWEFFGMLRNKYGAEANFVPGSANGGAAYVIADASKNVPLSPAFTSLLAKDGIAVQYSGVPGLVNTPKGDFAPRVGLAYQMLPKLVMRAAYGIFYAGFENLGGSPDPGTNYPFAVEPSLNDSTGGTLSFASQNASAFPNGGFATLENALKLVAPSPTNPAFNPQGSSFNAFATPWKTGYTQEWHFALQYALTARDSIQASYIGNHSLHQMNGFRINSPSEILPSGQGISTQNYVPYPDFAQNDNYISPNGDAYYYGLQFTYERRFSDGLGILANYTHSRCMTDFRNVLNDDTAGGLQRAAYLPGFGIKGDYTFCNDDSPNVVHLSGNWQIPYGRGLRFGHNANGFVNAVLGGWGTNFILTAQNGFPGTVGCPTSTTADFGCVAFMVPGQSLYADKGPHGTDQFLNPAAFSQPPLATTVGQTDYTPLGGKAGQFHGPSFDNLDFSLFKSFATSERTHLELRGELFNIFNHPNFANSYVTLDFTNSSFGQINNTTGNPRQVQLAMKFLW